MEVGWVARTMPGQAECGDRVVVDCEARPHLIAVIDGLGHGPRAAEAAEAVAVFVSGHLDLPSDELLRRCDRAAAGTRGVAMAVLRIDPESLEMTHAGVGNVAVTSHGTTRVSPISQPGVIGGRLRRVVVERFQLHPGDVLAVHSDGISSRMDLGSCVRRTAQQTAERLLDRYGKDHDDASCAVLRI